VHVFFEAVGYMISAQPNRPAQERLIANLMSMPNAAVCSAQSLVLCLHARIAHFEFECQWDGVMQQAAASVDVLSNNENIKLLANVLKTNVAACGSIGTFFLPQIGRIFNDMLGLYKAVSGIISETIAAQGLIATKTPVVRGLRTIKKEILKLCEVRSSRRTHFRLTGGIC
jgi:exportin-1